MNRIGFLLLTLAVASCGNDGDEEEIPSVNAPHEGAVVLFDEEIVLKEGEWRWGEITGDRKGAYRIQVALIAGKLGVAPMTIRTPEPVEKDFPGVPFSIVPTTHVGPYDPAILKDRKLVWILRNLDASDSIARVKVEFVPPARK